jgi:hypothetical protein
LNDVFYISHGFPSQPRIIDTAFYAQVLINAETVHVDLTQNLTGRLSDLATYQG